MRDLFIWYGATLVLGLACLPLTAVVLRRLPDHGWSLAKPLALLLLGFGCWLPPIIIHALPYSRGWIVLVALALVAGNGVLLVRRPAVGQELLRFARERWVYVAGIEALFAGGMGLMGWLRGFNPKIEGTEKFMDQAFVSAIMRAQHLPPPDPWYSGEPINYYYFGHFIIATLGKLLDTVPSVAFNVGIALTAGLAATAIGGVATNLCALILAGRHAQDERTAQRDANIPVDSTGDASPQSNPRRWVSWRDALSARILSASFLSRHTRSRPNTTDESRLASALPFGILAVVGALVLGNLRSFALWWGTLPDPKLSAAFNWLFHPALWQGYDWWTPSRAIPNGVITEFPNFSFQLADLHAHLLALPYTVLGLGIALNLWRLPRVRGFAALGEGWTRWVTLVVAGLCLGGLFLLNGWDLPTYLGIALIALVLHQWIAHDRLIDGAFLRHAAWLAGSLCAACLIPYLPFWLTFSSPGQGLGFVPGAPDHLAPIFTAANTQPVALGARTAIGYEIGIFGLPLFVLISWLLILVARRLVLLLPAFAPQRAAAAALTPTGESTSMLALTTLEPEAMPVTAAPIRGQRTPDTWMRSWGIVGIIFVTLAWLTWVTSLWEDWTFLWALFLAMVAGLVALDAIARAEDEAIVFPLILALAGLGLIALCEVVFLRDIFIGYSPRMNTIFKFYFQAWVIFAIAGAAALAWIMTHLADRLPQGLERWQPIAWLWRGLWGVTLAIMILMGIIYPLGASHTIYPLAQPKVTLSLNGLSVGALTQDDIDGIAWLNAHVSGSPVIVEANSSQADYSAIYDRVSTFTGLPTIMGWQGHEEQWRLNWIRDPQHNADFAARFQDIQTIYTSTDREQVLALLRHYHVAYIYVGEVERIAYQGNLRIDQLTAMFPLAYQNEGVMIFNVTAASKG